MREHDPNYPETTRPAGDPRRDPHVVQNRSSSGMGMIGVIAGIAIALVVGFLFWNMADDTDTADTVTPGQITTGAAPRAPAAPPTGTGAIGTTPPTNNAPANNAPANQGTTPAPSR